MMCGTHRTHPLVRRRPRPSATLRAVIAALGLSLAVLGAGSPDLTLAPLSAGDGRAGGPRPIDLVEHLPLRGTAPIDSTSATRLVARPRPPAGPSVDEQFQAALDAARFRAGAFGITFAAVRDGELLWSGASGHGRTADGGLSADTPLVIGSVTKTFVAATVLQLVDEGRLTLDDPVRRHLPELASIDPTITVRQLLDHTSGLADLFNDTTRQALEDRPAQGWTVAQVLASLHAPWYAPGEGWAYANTNYLLLGLIVERVTGSALREQLEARFIGPLGLATTRMAGDGAGEAAPLPAAWTSIFWASGAMVSSAPDLARWGDALYAGPTLSSTSRRAMLEVNSHDYGLGVQRVQLPGAAGYGHSGLLNTYTTLLLHLPEDDVTLALLVNRSEVDLGGMLLARPPGGASLLELVTEAGRASR